MKPEEQRIAIAELMGFTDIRMSDRWEVTDPPYEPIVLIGQFQGKSERAYKAEIPDYLNDLNAMRECEMSLEIDKKNFYIATLMCAVNHEAEFPSSFDWALTTATAKNKAKAFLQTHDKWIN
jgi:hypothetical protein